MSNEIIGKIRSALKNETEYLYDKLLTESTDYLKTISKPDWFTLQGYTERDYNLINPFLRTGTLKIPREELMKKIQTIDKIFEHAPNLSESITVFRGVAPEDLKYLFSSPSTRTFIEKGYLSTSMNVTVSEDFINPLMEYYPYGSYLDTIMKMNLKETKNVRCCVLKLIIPKGTPYLALEKMSIKPEEQEILFPRGCRIACRNFRSYKTNTTPILSSECTLVFESLPPIPNSPIPLKPKSPSPDNELKRFLKSLPLHRKQKLLRKMRESPDQNLLKGNEKSIEMIQDLFYLDEFEKGEKMLRNMILDKGPEFEQYVREIINNQHIRN